MKQLLIILFATGIMAKEIKVASYNVENLFDITYTGKEYQQFSPTKSNWSLELLRKKCTAIAHVINSLNADIIGLQEIESPEALHLLQKKVKQYKYSVFGEDDSSHSSVGTALLSKYPITTFQRHAPFNSQSRAILECTIAVDSIDLRIFVVHFPSKRQKESARVNSASRLRSILDTLPHNTEYLVLGDFNSSWNESENLLSQNMDDSKGITGINHILRTAKLVSGKFSSLFSAKEVMTDTTRLYNPWYEQSGPHRYTYRYQGNLSALDHILIPSTLLDNKGFNYVPGTFSHFTQNSLLTRDLTPYRWEMIRTKNELIHTGKGFSDHLPVMLLLSTNNNYEYLEIKSVNGSFEMSNDGWIVKSPHFLGMRTKSQSTDGSYSFQLTGRGKSNGTAASITSVLTSSGRNASIDIAGSGEFGFRIRKNGDSWYYVTDTGLTKSAAHLYKTTENKKWTQCFIPLYPFSVGDTVELQLRYKGDVDNNLYIDNCSLNRSSTVQER